jgi:flagellar biosynthesis GTPase FlhF
MRLSDLRACFSRYRTLSPDRIVAARCDEAASTGAVCSIAAEQEIRISYITQGEELADGIEAATLDRLLTPLFGPPSEHHVQPERTLAFAGGRA